MLTIFSKKNMTKTLLTFFIVILFSSCKQKEKDEILLFDFDGRVRECIIHIPENVKHNAALVFVLHGLGGTNKNMREYTRMNMVANKHGFVVCYPQGISSSKNTIYTKKRIIILECRL